MNFKSFKEYFSELELTQTDKQIGTLLESITNTTTRTRAINK